ncbi:hypothetical protein PARPLA_00886 [Rhodobacteraceae bacterium THAF1]|uniref:hypothetical protein n=1 Tax=Palleronia sp. THAF1 TaxID=2587842 RepID=UPI000F3F93DC|nr:hypothetical protein [Palleronia sp. THAF1]QFU07170.1 hypothetical protein FIU81_00595 [Palleronia sp. THAF1]VDC19995.1 hypothetical protein PARPLA_00886 [Rhodobacteraceae bacterium THAF1]
MNLQSRVSLFENQVDMTRNLLAQCRGMRRHLTLHVLPNLSDSDQFVVECLMDNLVDEEPTHTNLISHLDNSLGEIRAAIEAGTTEERVPIPAERLIGTSEAFDTYKSLTPAAEALKDALPPVERLLQTALDVQDFAKAVRLTLDLIDRE